ncbi:divalent cation transporter [Methanobrevibacter woesei]|uniref:Divalent cation transporter n=2 Tax=Methanobrevibacter woesei TaxID=190976 RepID=A0A2U1S5D6_9EURY|nr:divalent cation transporter [Methanobrevibacter woesei]
MIRQCILSILMFFANAVVFIFKFIEKPTSLFDNRSSKFVKYFSEFYSEHKRSIKEGLIALLICAVGDLCAGIILGNMTYFLETFPGLLVLIPGAIGMRGNIFGSFSSRLSTNLHIGILTPEFKKSDVLMENITVSFILTLVLSLFLAIIAKLICIIFGFESMSLIDFMLISLVAGLVSSLIMLPITMLISLKSFQNGWDPDNITTPLIAAFGDLFTLPAIIVAILILSLLNYSLILKYVVFVLLIVIVLAAIYYGFNSSEETKSIIKQSTPVLFICSVLGVFAGGIFNNSISTLLSNPTLLTLMPLFSGESGSIVSILGARLSSGLHSGLIEPILRPKKNTLYNFLIIIILAIIIYPIIGFMADESSYLLGVMGLGFDKTIFISLASGLILIPIMMVIVFYVSTLSYRRGYDPDNIVIPISTSITDSISSLILIGVSLIVTGAIVF